MKMKILYSFAVASILSFSISNTKAASIEASFGACQADGWAPFNWTWRVPEFAVGWPSTIAWDVDIQTSDSALFQFTAFTWGSASGDILYTYDGIVSVPKNNGISISNATTRFSFFGSHYNYLKGYGRYKVPANGRVSGTIYLRPSGFSSQVQSPISINLPAESCSVGPPPPPPPPPTCEVSIGSRNQIISLGEVNTSGFPTIGSVSRGITFDILLQNCKPNVRGVSLAFGGTADLNDSTMFRLTQVAGVATGLAVHITPFGYPGTTIAPNASDNFDSIPSDRVLSYTARYVRTGARVTPGPAPAAATVTLTYR